MLLKKSFASHIHLLHRVQSNTHVPSLATLSFQLLDEFNKTKERKRRENLEGDIFDSPVIPTEKEVVSQFVGN